MVAAVVSTISEEDKICRAMDLCEVGKLACNAYDSEALIQMEALIECILGCLNQALDEVEKINNEVQA